MSPPRARAPHCHLDSEARRREKARKIEVLLSRRRPLAGADLLDIGTGAGHIAVSLAESVGPHGRVCAVDVHDSRQTNEGFFFLRVGGVELPFRDEMFDIVVSNHVLEHVGGRSEQIHHLVEIRRVLRRGGLAYIAVPNRWRIVDRHFHLPFVSWLPSRWADRYVKITGRGEWYDVVPPTSRTMEQMLASAGLAWEDCTLEAMRVTLEVETTTALERLVLGAPAPVLRIGMGFVPSMIYVARRP